MNTHSENDINKVLTALRDTQPSAGLEQRILRGIQHRAPARTPLFMRWQLIAAVPTAALALFLATHFLASNTSLPVAPAAASAPTTKAGGPSTAAGGPSFAHFTKAGVPSERSLLAGVERGVSSNARPLSSTPPTNVSSRPEAAHFEAAVERPAASPIGPQLSAADRQALEDTNAPSQPPPPLPLSPDERILLAAAQRGRSVEVAQLDFTSEDPLRAAAISREDAAVRSVVQGFLKQLAAAEALNPTPPAAEASDPHPPADSLTPETKSAPDLQ